VFEAFLEARQPTAAVFRLRGRPSEANPGAVRYLARTGTYSIEKARSLLGYQPAVSLEDGLRATWQWEE